MNPENKKCGSRWVLEHPPACTGVQAPTQRHLPHRKQDYTTFSLLFQEGVLGWPHRNVASCCTCHRVHCPSALCRSTSCTAFLFSARPLGYCLCNGSADGTLPRGRKPPAAAVVEQQAHERTEEQAARSRPCRPRRAEEPPPSGVSGWGRFFVSSGARYPGCTGRWCGRWRSSRSWRCSSASSWPRRCGRRSRRWPGRGRQYSPPRPAGP